MVALCVAVLVALAIEASVTLDPEARRLFLYFDTVAALIFLVDFGLSLRQAEDKRRYLLTWGWIDFLSSIPSVAVLRWGRAARLARLVRLLRGVRSVRLLGRMVLARRRESTILAASLLALLTTFVGSVAILYVERTAGGNIASAADALWWTIVTMSTAGFGDLYPVTGAGRVVAILILLVGIALFASVTGLLASWLLEEEGEGLENSIASMRDEIRVLSETIRSGRP